MLKLPPCNKIAITIGDQEMSTSYWEAGYIFKKMTKIEYINVYLKRIGLYLRGLAVDGTEAIWIISLELVLNLWVLASTAATRQND